MSDHDDKIAELSARQYVRSVMLKTLEGYVGRPEASDEFIQKLNEKLLKGFQEIAREEVVKTLKELVAIISVTNK